MWCCAEKGVWSGVGALILRFRATPLPVRGGNARGGWVDTGAVGGRGRVSAAGGHAQADVSGRMGGRVAAPPMVPQPLSPPVRLGPDGPAGLPDRGGRGQGEGRVDRARAASCTCERGADAATESVSGETGVGDGARARAGRSRGRAWSDAERWKAQCPGDQPVGVGAQPGWGARSADARPERTRRGGGRVRSEGGGPRAGAGCVLGLCGPGRPWGEGAPAQAGVSSRRAGRRRR